MSSDLDTLTQQLRQFAQARDWEQFHAPKNLSMAISIEAAELMEHFQWLSEAQSKQLNDQQHQDVRHEMADIFLYLLRLADQLNIDLIASAEEKMRINEKKYPAEQARGRADKYTAYTQE